MKLSCLLLLISISLMNCTQPQSGKPFIEPSELECFEPVMLSVHVPIIAELQPGAVIMSQLPCAMTAKNLSYSITKKIQASDAEKPDYVSVEVVGVTDAVFEVVVESREFEGIGDSRHGQSVSATLKEGTIPSGTSIIFKYHTTSPWVIGEFPVYTAINGKRLLPDPTFVVKPDPAVKTILIVQSAAKPNEPFKVMLVSLDQYDNLSDESFSNIRIVNGDEVLVDEITYKGRFETTVSLPDEGVFRLEANGVKSNPIRITENPNGPYWGDIHYHDNASSDALGSLEHYTYAREVSGLDFASLSSHANGLDSFYWETRSMDMCKKYDDPGHFATILAVEFGGADDDGKRYHLNTYYYTSDDTPPACFNEKGKNSMTLDELNEYFSEVKGITALHHTGVSWGKTKMEQKFSNSTKFIEIYSSHGSSEYYDPNGNLSFENNWSAPFSASANGKFYARDGWEIGQHLFVIASSDDHNSQPGKRHNGLAAVRASHLDRTSILNAMEEGHTYGTTGERILLDFSANDKPMGSSLDVSVGDSVKFKLEVHGTDLLDSVEVFRFVPDGNKKWETAYFNNAVNSTDLYAEWTEASQGPSIYYARIRQENKIKILVPSTQERDVLAWSTPIWISGKLSSGANWPGYNSKDQ